MLRRAVAMVVSCYAVFSIGTLGCAHVETRRVQPNENAEGVHFYRPAPYLVRAIKDDKCTESIVYLPEKSEEWTMITHSGLGTVDASAKLADGWNLTEFGDARDSKIPETINAISGLVSAAAGAAARGPGAAPACATGLFKLTYIDNAWQLPSR